MRLLIFVFAIGWLPFTNAQADHEIDHRYKIRGYVLDASKRALADVEVRVSAGAEILERGKTDSNGYYSLHLHLHNEDNGRQLKLRAGSNETDLRVRVDRSDSTTIRVHEANFIGAEFVEGDLKRFRVPPWTYPIGGLLLIGTLLVFLEKRRKAKLRLKHNPAAGHDFSDKRKAKKTRRRRH